jgi:hypothetical protein
MLDLWGKLIFQVDFDRLSTFLKIITLNNHVTSMAIFLLDLIGSVNFHFIFS